MTELYQMDLRLRIYDQSGGYVDAKEDADDLGLVELVYRDGADSEHTMTFPPDMARAVAAAMVKVADHIDSKRKDRP